MGGVRHGAVAAALLALVAGSHAMAQSGADGGASAPASTRALPTLPAQGLTANGLAGPTSDSPVVMTADEVIHDEALGLIIARGRVELSQDARLVRADEITYNQRDGVVTASGNVVLVDDSGALLFADYAELDDDLADGFVHRIGLLLADDSRLAAAGGTRRAGGVTELDRAVYSPCDLCPDDPDRPPLWQLRARHVSHDAETEDITYRDAFLDIAGIPVLYSPYFAHPDPTVRQRSGFLAPDVGSTTEMGVFANSYYYWAIAPDRDATLRAGITSRRGPVAGGEYRQRFDQGLLELAGSLNHSSREDNDSADWRGHLSGRARFNLNDQWRTGGDLRLVSDNRYLRTFRINDASTLRSRAYLEGFTGDFSYASAEAFSFRSVRLQPDPMPTVLPWLQFHHRTEPGALAGGQGRLDASGLFLMRPADQEWPPGSGQTGSDTLRLSLEPGWQRTLHSDLGLVTSLNIAVRGNAYAERQRLGGRTWEWSGRVSPYGSASLRYPLVRQSGHWQQLIEPIGALSFAATGETARTPPNNDSIDLELDEISLFSANRFPGQDRVETGSRMTYGLRFGLFGAGGESGTLFFGQSHRFTTDSQFPAGSGLENRWSDFVGRITIQPNEFLDVDYRFRINNQEFADRRQELSLSAGPDSFRLLGTYTKINAVAGTGSDRDREEITAGLDLDLGNFWRARGSVQYDLAQREPRNIGFGLAYEDECTIFSIDFRRRYSVEPGSTRETRSDAVFLTITFRNLGETPLSLWSRERDFERQF